MTSLNTASLGDAADSAYSVVKKQKSVAEKNIPSLRCAPFRLVLPGSCAALHFRLFGVVVSKMKPSADAVQHFAGVVDDEDAFVFPVAVRINIHGSPIAIMERDLFGFFL